MAPSLSVFLTASRRPDMVRAICEVVRPVAGELLVGVDARHAEPILAACADVADRLFTYEMGDLPGAPVAWMHHQCRGEWILRLDDDEVPGQALLDALPELASERRRTRFLLPFRHLWPDRGSYLTSHPWAPDYHGRLLRNVPGLWTFSGLAHQEAEVLGESARLPGLPVYHLHYAIRTLPEREVRMHEQERRRPALLTERYPVNAMYVPERWTGVRTAHVPAGDRVLVDRVALAPSPPGAAAAVPVSHAPAAQTERHVAARVAPPGAYGARIRLISDRRALFAATTVYLEVGVRNTGAEHWPAAHQRDPLIRLAYRWLAPDGEVLEPEGLRTAFEETVAPGDDTVVMAEVRTPDAPGEYILELDVVHEFVAWFGCETRARVTVEALDTPPSQSSLPRPGGAQPSRR